MKPIWLIALVGTVLMAQSYTVLEAPGRSVTYEKAPERTDRSLLPGRAIYYIGGDPNHPREATGRISVSFTQEVAIEAFVDRYDLKNPRRTSRLYASWSFEVPKGVDVVALSAQIAANEPHLRYAKPDWVATDRRVK